MAVKELARSQLRRFRAVTALSAPRSGWQLRTLARVLRAGARHAWFVEDEVDGLDELIGPGAVCLDVGAEYGLYTWSMAAIAGPDGQVHAVEPQPGLAKFLKAVRRALAARTVFIHRMALSARSGLGTLSRPARLFPVVGRAFLKDNTSGLGSNGEFSRHRNLPITVSTLDELVADISPDRIDMIKADIEGAEGLLLEGGSETIRAYKPLLLLELEQQHLSRFRTNVTEITSHLEGLGYEVHSWNDSEWQTGTSGRNVLFVPTG